jgi:hypothetical protein
MQPVYTGQLTYRIDRQTIEARLQHLQSIGMVPAQLRLRDLATRLAAAHPLCKRR